MVEINLVKLKKYGKDISILYAEDDELIREQTKIFLARFFSNIDVAEDGLIGLQKFKTKKYDLVISDINMPNMNGIEMIKAIRELIPEQIVLVTSAYNDSEYLMQLINLEVMRFISKPFENKPFLIVLYKIVEELANTKEKQRLENELIQLSKRAQVIVDEINIGILLIKNNEIEVANKAFLDMGGFDSLETLKLEMPDIGVLFEEALNCINAPLNSEFIAQLQTAKEDEKKVRMVKNSKTFEYKVSYKKMDGEDLHILTFTDITAIHNALFKDEHTGLPIKKFILEKIDIYQKSLNEFKVIMLSIKNFKNVSKWYGKKEAIDIEVEFANKLKALKAELSPTAFIGHFGVNQFVIIGHIDDFKFFYQKVKNITIDSLKLKPNHESSNIDFHLSCIAQDMTIDSSSTLHDIEVTIINCFDDLS